MDREATIKLLRDHGANTVDMADAFVRGDVKIMMSDPHVVCIRHSCGVPMLWSDDVTFATEALKLVGDGCVLHGEATLTAFHNSMPYKPGEPCIQYCRLDREKFPENEGFDIRTLGQDDLPFIMEHYHRAHNPRYIAWRIDEGELQGAYVDGQLAGFIGSHSDGSIGMLEVLPQYRRRGIASALEQYQMNRHIDKGWTPYGQVYVSNAESHLVQKHVHLDVSTETISWAFAPDDDDD